MRPKPTLALLMRRTARLSGGALLAILLILAAPSHGVAQIVLPSVNPAVAAPTGAGTVRSALDDVLAKRKELAAQLATLSRQSSEHAAAAEAGNVSEAEDEIEYLETLDGVYAQQQVRLEERQELQDEIAQAAATLEAFHKFGPTEVKPYSFLLLEDLRDDLSAEEDHAEALDADIKPATVMLETAQDHFAEAEKDRRKAQEQVNNNDDKDQVEALATALKLAQRESRIHEALILVRRLEIEIRTLRCELCAARKKQLSEKIERIGQDVRFTEHDLQDRLKELTQADAELAAKLKDAQVRAKQAEARQAVELQGLATMKTPQAVVDLVLASWRVARDAQQLETSLLTERIGDNKSWRHYWECRYEVENGTAKKEEIEEWHESLEDLIDEMSANRHSLEQRIEATRIGQAKIVQRMRDNDDPRVKKWGDFQCAQWQKLRDICESSLVQLKVSQRWSERFLDELKAQLEPEEHESLSSVVLGKVVAVWTYELLSLNDQSITVGKVLSLMLYLLMAVVGAKVLSRLLGRRILPRFGLNEGASHAVQSIAFYTMLTLFGVMSFEMVHVPLSAFTFLGGAVAIAVGFGSQDIANNFMSGIILLAEQPIRVGDIIVVDGVQGTVAHIGPRSTRIKTDSNYEMIVPNSKVLSDKLTNLTLSDTLVQTSVAVTLPNKMPVAQAKVLLLQAALSHYTVLREPCPIVLFKQFGATSMDFVLHFWLQLDDEMRAAIAQSDVREEINELFNQYGAQAAISDVKPASVSSMAPRASNAA
jgi:potassium efflux system protein